MAKGRNKRLIENRNRKILERYYYWTETQRLRFDDAVKQLAENEFFLSEQRIWRILRTAAKKSSGPPVKKPRVPRITEEQLSLFTDEQMHK